MENKEIVYSCLYMQYIDGCKKEKCLAFIPKERQGKEYDSCKFIEANIPPTI